MAKAQTFAEKVAKASAIRGVKCPQCGTVRIPLLYVASARSAKTGNWRFQGKRVQVCKCNEKEIYG
ncbi:MAG: hypothetical protein COS95_02485 [Ignavibacteriales bacterium CG07_land_8_20_14_0_80_59_12]|jgi:uncharacterized OB-fold protein|nr:MAG: hypothetical protein COS95_02485 [Ignavibacteriales bacterium CG07_land_8_20_14_0_80_59_12]